LLDDYGETKALFNSTVIPDDFTGDEVVNYYDSGTYNVALEYGDYIYTINCRSKTESGSKAIASEIISLLNRVFYNYIYVTISKLATIKPIDETDIYNTPLLVQILDKE
jgi:hypothetical protein